MIQNFSNAQRDVACWPVSTVRRNAAILPKLEDKPTSREPGEYVEVDPEQCPGFIRKPGLRPMGLCNSLILQDERAS